MIFGYYSTDFSKTALAIKTAPYREFIRGHMPVAIQDAIKSKCGDIAIDVANNFAATLPITCDLDFSDDVLSDAADLLRSLPDMLYKLQFQIAVNDSKVFNYEGSVKEIEKLMQAIKEHQQ